MKKLVNISRILVGVLFIFSGLVKAIDPHGLAYKMQEFFEVWKSSNFLPSTMSFLYDLALPFSIVMITLEIVVGVGLLLGKWKSFFTWLLLLLILFFAFLTGYAALSGKISTCGCFGDCIPLTSMESFIKDIVLLILILIIFFGRKYIHPVFSVPINIIILFASFLGVLFIQWYVMRHLPLVDCLPFKVGNNILEERKIPANAVPDVMDYRFTYEKDGKDQEFPMDALPDSTWTFVKRHDVLVKKGSNNEAPIKDFNLNSASGNDSTEAILSQPGDYYMFFIKDIEDKPERWEGFFTKLYAKANAEGKGLIIVSSNPDQVSAHFHHEQKYDVPVFSLDGTSFKTAARTDPELYLMHGPVVKEKWGWADFGDW